MSKSNVANTIGGIRGVSDKLMWDMVKAIGIPLEHIRAIAQWTVASYKGELIWKGVCFKPNAAGKCVLFQTLISVLVLEHSKKGSKKYALNRA